MIISAIVEVIVAIVLSITELGFKDGVLSANEGDKEPRIKLKHPLDHMMDKRSIAEEMDPTLCPSNNRCISQEACTLVAKFVNDSHEGQGKCGETSVCCSFEKISDYARNLPGKSMNDKIRILLTRLLIVALRELNASDAGSKEESKKSPFYPVFNSSEATPSS